MSNAHTPESNNSAHNAFGVPLPPMSPQLWGTPEEAKPLNEGIKKILSKLLGASADPDQQGR
ncbi:Hypothetical protein NG00_01811 [Corynebacterium camporealensis]|uniref:Uncharacterized protein n=1 Tax=Corynebacterium camporealensis TaxID=161896 RepID=A0A0F6QY61_9CORY|nr:hypothetical protein [Corynebacterium camporealensis]AKE39955.1 hypothetical protein UL81_10105 [Corynebacterium camporealensis]AVH89050.1 Hypothetical protein NG00_01811 [Corynebacterium camporealensis]